MATKYLKRWNTPTVIVCLLWSVALFLIACNGTTTFWGSLRERIHDLGARDSLFGFLTPLILPVACGLLPSSWKASLVFWRGRDALPGCRAFTKLAKCDPRVDEARLKKDLGKMPASRREENAVWYRWYKTVEDRPSVQESHRQFLLNRDLAGISFLFFTIGTLALYPAGASGTGIGVYAAITMLQFIVFAVVARNHGNRFVCNVLVEYQNRKQNV